LLKNISLARNSHNETNSIEKVPKAGWTLLEKAKAFLMPENTLKHRLKIIATPE
jgi:hypothetical protein